PRLVGCPRLADTPDPADWIAVPAEDAERWQALRRSPHASALALALPRFLLRLPYGPKSDPIDAFPFDELAPARTHESYLWGNPAFACAQLAIAAFRARGEEMELGEVTELDDLPCHTFREDGEPR